MTEELHTLRDITGRLEAGGIDYMLTGSMALNCYAQPRMTRDIDLVVAFFLKDAGRIQAVLGLDYYVSAEAAREAVLHQSSFNAIHQSNLMKVDLMVRKHEEYRHHEFSRRMRLRIGDFSVWVVSKEGLDSFKAGLGQEFTVSQAICRRGEPDCHRMRHGLPPHMVSKIEPDRYADTGFSVKDTPPEVNAMIFQAMMRRAPGERLRMGMDMMATARALVWASLPGDLTGCGRRRAFYRRFYGEDYPSMADVDADH